MARMRFSLLLLSGVLLGSTGQAAPVSALPYESSMLPADTPKPAETYSKLVDLVQVIFTVTDKRGEFVKDLKQDQFKLLDNNLPPKEIVGFESQTDLPLRVGLLFDNSNSIRERFLFEQQATGQFLRKIIRPQSDKAFVLAFDEVPEVTQDFTSDPDKLNTGIQVIRPGGGTAMWDAVYYACRDKMMKEENNTPVRRAIILLSDGDDNQSRVLRQEAVEMAQRAEVIIYTISTNLNNIQDSGDHNLQALADATGGRAFYPYKVSEISDDLSQIQSELRSQYSISYKPDDFIPNGQFRSIQIIPANKRLMVRARKGYFTAKR
ncbi:MAG TPA: VWA domain-containing protein [Terriglobales bacterium]|jgi:Ca-activated chloride channel family protein|nr:VWA domain-containing protein [Terriglobales bacterium]